MATPKFSSLYDHHVEPGIGDWGPSLTKQEFAQEADINYLLAQYEKHGIIPDTNSQQPIYADCTAPELSDYHRAQNMVVDTNERFASLPAKVRERFANDPIIMLQFLSDGANYKEAVELGLIPPEPAPTSPSSPPSEAGPKTGESK